MTLGANTTFISYRLNRFANNFEILSQHALIFVKSGLLTVKDQGSRECFSRGEFVFLRRYHQFTLEAVPENSTGIYEVHCLEFPVSYLKNYQQKFFKSFKAQPMRDNAYQRIAYSNDLESVFLTAMPYLEQGVMPLGEIHELRIRECLIALLHLSPELKNLLFDYHSPWKIDIASHMEQTFAFNIPLKVRAAECGRSLATFKRDFARFSSLTPARWILSRRLTAAYHMLMVEKKQISEIYSSLGFKSLSHFSTAFKNKYHFPPTKP